MRVALILLTPNNVYVSNDGKLPKRPEFDKSLLASVIDGELVSPLGYSMLPPSMQKVTKPGPSRGGGTFPITIPEIDTAKMLIVSRSNNEMEGKVFRMDNFKILVKQDQLEIWIRKD